MDSNRKNHFLIFGVVGAVQLIFSSLTFPLIEIWSKKPLFYIDNAFHWYQLTVALNLARDGNVMGYDPFFGAGSVAGITTNLSAKFPAVVAYWLQPHLSVTQSWKGFVFVASIVGPLCVPVAFRWLNVSVFESAVGAGLGLLLWWVSIFRWYHTAGMVSFVLAAYLSLPYLAYQIRYLTGRVGHHSLLWLGGSGALLVLLHPLIGIAIIVGTASWLVSNRRTVPFGRAWRLVIVVPIISLVPHGFWLYPQMVHPLIERPQVITYQAIADFNIIWMQLVGMWGEPGKGAKVYPLLAFLTVWGIIKVERGPVRQLVLAYSFAGAVLICFGAFGASFEVVGRLTQPNRFAVVGYLFLCVPAALGMTALLKIMKTRTSPSMAYVIRGSFAIVLLLTLFNLNELRRELSYRDIGHYGVRPPEIKGMGPYSDFVLRWLSTQTSTEGRVLFETSKTRIHDNGHLAGFYAYSAGREFIGGPYPFSNFTDFWDRTLMGRPIQEVTEKEFWKYADLYNLGWIIVHSGQSKDYFDNIPGVVPVQEFLQLKTYRIERRLDYFLKGSGRVQAPEHNRLTLSEVEGDEVIIKYHYIQNLRSDPSTSIRAIKYPDDPNPFIGILNPPSQLTLYLP